MDSVYTFLRKKMNWTQASIVSRFNNYEYFCPPTPNPISEQFLRRVEMGMVATEDHDGLTKFWQTVDHNLSEHLSEYREDLLNEAAGANAPILPVDTQPASIPALFESWVIIERYKLRPKLDDLTLNPGETVAYLPVVVHQILEAVTTRLEVPPTVYAFCRELKLHPFIVQRWAQRGGIMPVGVREALLEAGADSARL